MRKLLFCCILSLLVVLAIVDYRFNESMCLKKIQITFFQKSEQEIVWSPQENIGEIYFDSIYEENGQTFMVVKYKTGRTDTFPKKGK